MNTGTEINVERVTTAKNNITQDFTALRDKLQTLPNWDGELKPIFNRFGGHFDNLWSELGIGGK